MTKRIGGGLLVLSLWQRPNGGFRLTCCSCKLLRHRHDNCKTTDDNPTLMRNRGDSLPRSGPQDPVTKPSRRWFVGVGILVLAQCMVFCGLDLLRTKLVL